MLHNHWIDAKWQPPKASHTKITLEISSPYVNPRYFISYKFLALKPCTLHHEACLMPFFAMKLILQCSRTNIYSLVSFKSFQKLLSMYYCNRFTTSTYLNFLDECARTTSLGNGQWEHHKFMNLGPRAASGC